MNQLIKLFEEVKDENLDRHQLEMYHTELSSIYALMELEMAGIEKAEAIFLGTSGEKTAVMATRKWAITTQGQRQIELKRQLKATEKVLSSVKSRVFNKI